MKANILKAKLALHEISLLDLSKKLDITKQGLYQKIRGERDFKLSEIAKIKDILELTNDEVFEIFIQE